MGEEGLCCSLPSLCFGVYFCGDCLVSKARECQKADTFYEMRLRISPAVQISCVYFVNGRRIIVLGRSYSFTFNPMEFIPESGHWECRPSLVLMSKTHWVRISGGTCPSGPVVPQLPRV